ncbi:MAG: PAS domain-containing protein [bacterium]|nr:hypothetical protein [Deltaproteobacteria bacterium]MCP4906929.1 PAS domain-containing protein [bacterium]
MAYTTVDISCEVDETGRIVYVSAAIQGMIGDSTEQVTNSHFRLWIPRNLHERVTKYSIARSPCPRASHAGTRPSPYRERRADRCGVDRPLL